MQPMPSIRGMPRPAGRGFHLDLRDLRIVVRLHPREPQTHLALGHGRRRHEDLHGEATLAVERDALRVVLPRPLH